MATTSSDDARAPRPTDVAANTPDTDLARQRLHAISPFFSLVRYARQLVAPLLIAIVAGRDADFTQLLIGVPLVVGSIIGVVGYLRFSYRIEDGAVVVEEGVVTRKRRIVPLDRIQQVDVEAQLLHRALGVVTVRLDTAGGGSDADVTLAVVSRDQADQLAARLARRTLARSGGGPGHKADDARAVEAELLLRIPPSELALAGVTGRPLLFALPFLGPLIQFFDDVPETLFEAAGAAAASPSRTVIAVVTIAIVAGLWIGGAALSSVLNYGGYTLTRRGGDLRVESGVFSRREATVAIDRVQAVRIHQNLIRRWIGRCSVHIQSGAVTGARTRLVVPIVGAAGTNVLLHTVLPGVEVPTGPLETAPPAARRRAILRRTIPMTIASIAAVAFSGATTAAVAFAVVAIGAAIVAGEAHYRGLGLAMTASVVVGRAGGLLRSTVVVPSARVQAVRIRSTPLQRRAGLATLELPLAGSGATPTVFDQAAAGLAEAVASVLPASAADERRVRRSRAVG